MYYTIFHSANIIFYICLAVSVLFLMQKIIYHIFGLIPSKKLPDAKKNHKFAILIPARNESKVIEGILNSIKEQNYDHALLDTFVIVESEDDPTCEIVKKYPGTHIFVRQHLELKGKGHALDEVVKHIFSSGEKFDAFFICDADNILSKNFIAEMNKCYEAGFDIAVGYRNSKNWNGGWIASGSALTFSMVNTFQNKGRARFNQKVVLSGTGFYVASHILEKLGGWKFFELTEDVEFSMFCIVNDLKATYNEYAEFYDEQPTKLKVSWNQRLRWVKGFTTVQKKYKKKLFKGMLFDKHNKLSKYEYVVNILPVVCLLVTAIAYAAFNLVFGIVCSAKGVPLATWVWIAFAAATGSIYGFFVLYAAIMLFAERKHTNITFWNVVTCCLMFPIFSAMYIPIFFQSVFKKEVEWKPIVHSVTTVENQTVEFSLEESKSARLIDEMKSKEGIVKSEEVLKPFLTTRPNEEKLEFESKEENNFEEQLA